MTATDREVLDRVAGSVSAPYRDVTRARVLLAAADGVANSVIAARYEVTAVTVRAWRTEFTEKGLTEWGTVKKGRGRKATISDEQVSEIVRLTTQEKPKGHTHWSCRTMAARVGVSPATVQRIWHDLGLAPHRLDTFKVSNDPRFTEKLIDVVGLYLNPPEQAIVLCMDEKSSIQALDRTQASLPMVKGRAGTMTHDYKRNGTTTLFAALNVLTGLVIGKCLPRHRHQEFLVFLKEINRRVARGKDIHLILDNYGTHTKPEVVAWLEKHPRFHLHFTPTSSSWLNLVERWFRELTTRRLKRGSFASVAELIDAIEDYIAHHNDDPKPFVWTKTADEILTKVRRGRVALEQARVI